MTQIVPAVRAPHLSEVDDAGVVVAILVKDVRSIQISMGKHSMVCIKEPCVTLNRLPHLLPFPGGEQGGECREMRLQCIPDERSYRWYGASEASFAR
jgi:hypothetical protein